MIRNNMKLIGINGVIQLTGLPSDTIFGCMGMNAFPEAFRIGESDFLWIESEVRDWCKELNDKARQIQQQSMVSRAPPKLDEPDWTKGIDASLSMRRKTKPVKKSVRSKMEREECFGIVTNKLYRFFQEECVNPVARTIILHAIMKYDGHNNGSISLPYSEFRHIPGLITKKGFYKHRQAAINLGVLTMTKAAHFSSAGRFPSLYAIDPQYLHS